MVTECVQVLVKVRRVAEMDTTAEGIGSTTLMSTFSLFLVFVCLQFCVELFGVMSSVSTSLTNALQDDFTQCFRQQKPKCWNWNLYLYPLWCFGVLVRYVVFLPLRYG